MGTRKNRIAEAVLDNEYTQSMFSIKNKKTRHTPVNPSFYYIKCGLRGYTFHGHHWTAHMQMSQTDELLSVDLCNSNSRITMFFHKSKDCQSLSTLHHTTLHFKLSSLVS